MKKVIIILIAVIVLFSCDNRDNNSDINSKLIGSWQLKNVKGGFAGVDIDYRDGEVSWEFVSKTNILIVKSSIINTGPQSAFLPLQSGNYNFSLTESNGKTFVKIEGYGIYDNGDYGLYVINDNGELIINQGEGSEAKANDVFVLFFD